MKYLILLVALSGCGSLHTKVSENVHIGDSEAAVVASLGDPYGAQHGLYSTKLVYQRKADVCTITLDSDQVVDFECHVDEELRAQRKMLAWQAFSGMSAASRPVHCLTTGGYGVATTNCQ